MFVCLISRPTLKEIINVHPKLGYQGAEGFNDESFS
jgi:hypothetical protein